MTTSFSGKNAYKHLEDLTVKIGPRHGGSTKEVEAAHYIRDYFKSLGLKTKLEPYKIYSYEDAEGSLTTPDGEEIECIALPMTTSTPDDGITAETVFIDGNDDVCLDESVTGKIVVMFNSFGGELQKKFHDLKPAGLVSIQTDAHKMHFRGANKPLAVRKHGSVPTLKLTWNVGIKLVENLPAKLTMKVKTIDEGIKTGYNVIADLPGTEKSDDVFIICGHYDSVWQGPGAIDNGGGVAAVMEFARVFKENGSRWNMRFVAFGGEEMGLFGSKSYVRKLKDEDEKLKKDKNFKLDGLKTELDKIRFVINLDMMGPLYGNSTAITIGHSDIPASVRLLAKEMRYPIIIKNDHIYSSDNIPFNVLKIPSLSFFRCGFGDGGGHTVNDIIENCSPEGLEHIGSYIEAWINRYIDGMHVFPFPQSFSEASQKAIEARNVDDIFADDESKGPGKLYKKSNKKK